MAEKKWPVLLVIHIIHVHATTYLVFTVGIFGTGITIHRRTGSGGILSWFLFCLCMGRMRQLDDPFRLQVVGMELTDNGLFQLDSLSIPWHSSLTCSKWVMERWRKNNQLSYWADLRDWRIGQNGNQDRSYISDFDRFNSGNDDDTPLLPFNIDPKE